MIVRRGWQAITVGAIGALALLGSAAASPTTKFVSKQNHYSVVVPGSPQSWQRTAAIVAWTQVEVEQGAQQFDTLLDGRTAWFFIIGERALPAGSTLGSWTSSFLSAKDLGCKRTSSISSARLGGQPASSFEFSCPDGVTGLGVDALHGPGGYFMVLSSRQGPLGASFRKRVQRCAKLVPLLGHLA